MGHLIAHYDVVGGDSEVIKCSKVLQEKLGNAAEGLGRLLSPTAYGA